MEKTPRPTHGSHKTEPAKPEPHKAAKADPADKPEPDTAAPAASHPDDGKHGQGLLARVQERRRQLGATLAQVKAMTGKGEPESGRADDLEKALAAVETMLTGDLDHLTHTNTDDLSRWLESSAILQTGKAGKPAPTHKAPTRH